MRRQQVGQRHFFNELDEFPLERRLDRGPLRFLETPWPSCISIFYRSPHEQIELSGDSERIEKEAKVEGSR